VKILDKDKLLEALNKIQNGEDAGGFYDELETLTAIVVDISDDVVAAAWKDISTDTQEIEPTDPQ
jgi:hypothetical protein